MGHLPSHAALLLIGLRGSGKSTIGRALALRLGRPFVDLDDLSPGVLGCEDAAEAIRSHGEPTFRRAELAALQDVLRSHADPAPIVSLGGGTPTAHGVTELIDAYRASGRVRVVYLRATEATLRARLERADNAHRPSLTGKGVLEEIGVLLNLRDTLYTQVADHIVGVDSKTAEQVAGDVMAYATTA